MGWSRWPKAYIFYGIIHPNCLEDREGYESWEALHTEDNDAIEDFMEKGGLVDVSFSGDLEGYGAQPFLFIIGSMLSADGAEFVSILGKDIEADPTWDDLLVKAAEELGLTGYSGPGWFLTAVYS